MNFEFKNIIIFASMMYAGNLSLLANELTLLNVSYDPTRKFYSEYNRLFSEYWKTKKNNTIKIYQSHGGSGKQARAVLEGLEADVVTLGLSYDIDIIASKGLISSNWQKSLPHNSSPYTSVIVFVIRKGNPKNIKDWDDLIKPNIGVITPNPKTSGGARWNYLAAWGYAAKKFNNDTFKIHNFIKSIFQNVPALDSGARGSSSTFTQNEIGDVLIAWESEAFLILNEMGKDNFEIILPSVSILAEPPVAVIKKNAERHGTEEVAIDYLNFLYSDSAQDLIAKHGYRPRNEVILKKFESKFPKLELLTIDSNFGGWAKAQKEHFSNGGTFDKLYIK